MPSMLDDFHADLLRTSDHSRLTRARRVDPRRVPHLLFHRVGLHALAAYRAGRWLREARRRPASWPLALLAAPVHAALTAYVRLGLDIHLDASADLGPGLQIFHLGGIRLRRCRLGADCVIHQEVRLEPAPGGGEGPWLGDRVWVGPHARIVGPVRIGDGATIGAGAFVTADVPPCTLVLGDPARTVRVAFDNAGLRERLSDQGSPSRGPELGERVDPGPASPSRGGGSRCSE